MTTTFQRTWPSPRLRSIWPASGPRFWGCGLGLFRKLERSDNGPTSQKLIPQDYHYDEVYEAMLTRWRDRKAEWPRWYTETIDWIVGLARKPVDTGRKCDGPPGCRRAIRCVIRFAPKSDLFRGARSIGAEGIRTPDLRIANASLSQLSYSPARGNEYTASGRERKGNRSRQAGLPG
jgi:hypothetical protein